MDKKIAWIIIAIVILLLVIAGASFGTVYYLAQKAKTTPTPSPSTSTCTTCGKASPSTSTLSTQQIKEAHCLQNPQGGTGNITIADIAHYSEVSSPITFSGTANVFEGSFQVRLIDCDGNKVIKQRNAQTQAGEVGVSNPYSVTITYSSSYAGHYAYIEAYDLSAKDGSVQDTIQVPVLLK